MFPPMISFKAFRWGTLIAPKCDNIFLIPLVDPMALQMTLRTGNMSVFA